MLVEEFLGQGIIPDVVEAIFPTDNRDEANAVIEEFSQVPDEYHWN